MHKLSFIILLFVSVITFGQSSPHGANFNYNCSDCHTTNTWKVNIHKLKFDHAKTGFELSGQHAALQCQSCHSSLDFITTKNNCFNCHNDIHQNSVGKDCQQCHNSKSWLVENINEIHQERRFPLIGAHAAADCQQCHSSIKNLVFEQVGIDCKDCHIKDFQSAKNPDHVAANFSTDCEECHAVTDPQWALAKFAHNFFPLTGGHKISNCFDCHNSGGFEGLTQDCFTCHKQDFNSTTDPNHITSNFPNDCKQCHTTNPGWKPASFKVHDQYYALLGAHKTIENDCAKCHTTGYKNTPTDCYSCHKTNFDATNDPVHTSAGFGTDCESCHNSTAWKPATFDHDNQYFPIYSGKHNNQWNACSDCHTNQNDYGVFSCLTCHEHSQSKMDEEHSGIQGYTYVSEECLACHPSGQKEGSINHSETAFPLTGAHLSVDCTQCHTAGFKGTPTDCASCHSQNFQSTSNPNHSQMNLSNNCEQCHTTNPGWKPAQFTVHDDYYVLQGAHLNIKDDCNSCHTNAEYKNTPDQCYGCHKQNYDNTNDPSHKSANFTTDCETCHTATAWTPATFDHDNQYFPIYSGKHNNQWNACSDCHTNSADYNVFECTTCHDHNKTKTDDEHKGIQGYSFVSTECLACHPTGSKDGAFDHSTSVFPLTGSHQNQDCAACHANGYANTPTECFACHDKDFNSSVNPKHAEAGISQKCEDCHNTSAWQPSTFKHSSTGFDLVGGHVLPQCSSCHQGNTANASSDCYSCHEAKYNSAKDHQAQNYPKTCEQCHNTTTWEDATFDHAATNFPLTGAHQSVNCSDCHTTGYKGTSTDCNSCHQNDFQSTTNPSHSKLGLSTNCAQCHTTKTGWKPAEFAVHNNYYVLEGAHASIANDCNTCHNGNYNSTPNTCYGCHQSDYNATNDPVHKSAGFGTDCESCHSQNAWKPSTFDHDGQYFPIYSGKHRNEWNACSDCHTNQNDFGVFSCLTCHEHSQTKMNDKHSGVNNYSYNSNACYNCHPTGREEEGGIAPPVHIKQLRLK